MSVSIVARALIVVLAGVSTAACARSAEGTADAKRVDALEKAVADLSSRSEGPDLGETMQHVHTRHQRLATALDDGNWQLAEYLLDEMGEALNRAGKTHPKAKQLDDVPRAVSIFYRGPSDHLDDVIKQRDAKAAPGAFDALTAGCNGCHSAAGLAFNVIRRPGAPSAPTAAR